MPDAHLYPCKHTTCTPGYSTWEKKHVPISYLSLFSNLQSKKGTEGIITYNHVWGS